MPEHLAASLSGNLNPAVLPPLMQWYKDIISVDVNTQVATRFMA